ncbi:MAG: glutamate-1-semialdehyde 2,1-aminomutase [Planctomycetota bacterium]
MSRQKNADCSTLWEEAIQLIPGGLNSSIQISTAERPLFIKKVRGSKVICCDNHSYIDFIMSRGALITGHAHPKIIETLKKNVVQGTCHGLPTQQEIELAELITEAFPSIQKVRLVNSSTEALITAIRLASAFTKRSKILKFTGCHNGQSNIFSCSDLNNKNSNDMISIQYNDVEALANTIDKHRNKNGESEFASIVIETCYTSMGVIMPKKGFLQSLRNIATKEKIVLIFDEVNSGFRASFGGAQELYGIMPDITVLGKVLGGGLPIGAFGGKEEIMQLLAPEGKVHQTGNLTVNHLSVAAGIATLKLLRHKRVYHRLETLGTELEEGILTATKTVCIPVTINRVGSMLSLYFTQNRILDFEDVMSSDPEFLLKFHVEMRKRGVLIPPTQFESLSISLAHSDQDIRHTISAVKKALEIVSREI